MVIFGDRDFNPEGFVRRMERVGASNVKVQKMETFDAYVIDFMFIDSEHEGLFKSSIEMSDDGKLEHVQLRLPTFKVEPSKSGISRLNFRENVKSNTMDKWLEMKEDIAEILYEEAGVQVEFGVVQNRNINIRSQHGPTVSITPHIEFERGMNGLADITKEELIKIMKRLNEMFEEEYFDVTVVGRQENG